MIDVSVHDELDLPPGQLEAVRRRAEELDGYTDEPVIGARLTLRSGPGRTKNRFVVDASMLVNGRLLVAHTAAPSPLDATEAAVERMRRQLRRAVGAEVAERDEPDEIRKALREIERVRTYRPEAKLKPPEERRIIRRRTYSDRPEATLEAIADMLDLDEEFHLFVHARTSEDVVVHRRDDKRVGLIHPLGSILADETDDVVVAEPNRYKAPLMLEAARSEMDLENHRFMYFIDSEDRRGKVLYLRHDGDYGLVEPE